MRAALRVIFLWMGLSAVALSLAEIVPEFGRLMIALFWLCVCVEVRDILGRQERE